MKRRLVFFILAMAIALNISILHVEAAEPIVVAYPTTMDFPEGYQGRDAAILATEEINSRGGVNVGGVKRPLKLYAINTRGALPGVPVNDALMAYKKIIMTKKPDFIAGGAYRSEVLMAAMDYVAEKKLVHIANEALTPAYDKKVLEDYEKYKYFFRTTMNSIDFARLLAGMMGFLGDKHGLRRAYIVIEDANWAVGTGNFMSNWLKKNNFEVLGYDKFPIGSTDFSSALIQIKKKKADVMLVAFSTPQAPAIMMKQWHAMKVPALPTGIMSSLVNEKAWDSFDGKVEWTLVVTFTLGHFPAKKWPKSVEFAKAFKKRFGPIIAGTGAGPGYDAIYVAADAIERAGSLDTDKFIKALEETDYKGVTGRIRFGKDHKSIFGLKDPNETAMGACFQWRAPGVRVPVFPYVIADQEIGLPPWMKKK
ncbi:MAG: ABC transporter substrate-binding protein [Thermodesulfobacteriota bacterium]|nr:ABC transporter substrate-binding protein [Thermodesulfobacteriota bacterium]